MGKRVLLSAVGGLLVTGIAWRPQYQLASIMTGSGAPSAGLCSTIRSGHLYVDISVGRLYSCNGAGVWVSGALTTEIGGGALPSGFVGFVTSGGCPQGTVEATDLDGQFLEFTTAAHGDVGQTGGADAITPEGTNGAQTFTGAAWTPPAIAWPGGVPTFSGAEMATHLHAAGTYGAAAQTFTGTPFSSIINHMHALTTIARLTTGSQTTAHQTLTAANDTTSTQTAAATDNPAGGVSSITPAGTNGSSAVTGSSAAITAGTPSGTVAWPAGVPTIGAYTPAGTVTVPSFAGTQFNNRPAFTKVIPCRAN